MNTDHLPATQPDGETVVCACLHRTEAEIRDAVARLGLDTFEDVAAAVLAGSGCTTCRPEIETILRAIRDETQRPGEPGDLPENVDNKSAGAPAAGRTGL